MKDNGEMYQRCFVFYKYVYSIDDFLKETQIQLSNIFKEINPEKIRKGAVHLDLWADNLNIDSNNKITLFDFDFCGNGFLSLDIAFHVMMLFLFEPDQEKLEKKTRKFHEGYESVLVISEEEFPKGSQNENQLLIWAKD